MLQIHYSLFYVVFMIILLGCSAFFSGSETALFSLSRNSIKTMQKSKHRLEHLIAKLLQKPEQLLGWFFAAWQSNCEYTFFCYCKRAGCET
jgi:Mg2+/Co2+ transporter CorB